MKKIGIGYENYKRFVDDEEYQKIRQQSNSCNSNKYFKPGCDVRGAPYSCRRDMI